MSRLLVEQLAEHLDLPAEEANSALSEFVTHLHQELDRASTVRLPGLGTFDNSGEGIAFTADEALALAINNRFGALDDETVSAGLGNPDLIFSSDNVFSSNNSIEDENNDELDQSLIDRILSEDLSETKSFSDPLNENTDSKSNDDFDLIASFEEDFFSTDSNQIDTPSSNASVDASLTESISEDTSMKENEPNPPNNSEQESNDFDTEWSPFFEELEGEEFDIDSTIDLSAEDWQSEIPSPPSSPFASPEEPADNPADDAPYFDVDADADDTLFSPASMDVDDPAGDSWATVPLDETTDFFEDDASISASFGDQGDTISTEDEFFSPASGTTNLAPEDTLFSTDTIYAEDASVEADDTIFLAPDQTIEAESDTINDRYAPPPPMEPSDKTRPMSEDKPAEKPPRATQSPYAYNNARKKRSSGWPWILGALLLVALLGTGAYMMGWLPFGNSGSAGQPPIAAGNNPPATDPPAQPQQAITPAPDPSANDPVIETPTTTPAAPPPIQRIGIDRSRGGWTIVVTSELQRSDAERTADGFAQRFEALRFPIDILVTNQYAQTRHRVGVGQFDSIQEASAILRKFKSDLPNDAWLLRIE